MYTTKEAAKKLKVSPRTIQRLITNKEIAHFTMGRVVRIAEHDLNDFINAKTIPAAKTRVGYNN
jgi:excisionase family DNA binding protein